MKLKKKKHYFQDFLYFISIFFKAW